MCINGNPSATFDACPDTTYLIAVGGNGEYTGSGTLSFTLEPEQFDCPPPLAAPIPDVRFDINGTVKACATDDDCKTGVSGPNPQTVCRDSDGDAQADACYVARQRYLSLNTDHPIHNGWSRAYRISLQTTSAGLVPLGFVNDVSQISPWPTPSSAYRHSRATPTPGRCRRTVRECGRGCRVNLSDDVCMPVRPQTERARALRSAH